MILDISHDDTLLVMAIATRARREAAELGVPPPDALTIVMDLTACHANGMRLRLGELYAARRGDFAHDVFGIHRHIDRRTGKLSDMFVPRYAA